MRRTISVFALSGLAACSYTYPIAVVTKAAPSGVMRGQGTASLLGGEFSVSDGPFVCSGTYDATDHTPTIRIPVRCNDGRVGLVTSTRDSTGMSGGGRFTLNDGSTGDFIFGRGAERM